MTKETGKNLRKYTRLYRNALIQEGFPQAEEKARQYRNRLEEMYASPEFAAHNIYPAMNVSLIYAVIAMCLELRDLQLGEEEIIRFSETAFAKRRKAADLLIHLIDLFPGCFAIVKQWNINDYEKRVQDGSIGYDRFMVSTDRIEYSISKCMYAEMFRYYGIRRLCRIFCNTDTRCYAGLRRHVRFIRHSDLSDGNSCTDEICRKRGKEAG